MSRLNKFISILLICTIFLTACDSIYDKVVTQPLNNLISTAIPKDPKTDEKNEPSDSLLPDTRSSSPGRTGIAFSSEGYPDIGSAMQGIASTGVSFVRLEFPIEEIQETTSHHEVWDNGFKEKVAKARANNLHIIGLLTYGPNPAFYEVGDDTAFFELWRKYVQVVVDQFGNSIDHWEIGNEQNRLFFWNKVRKQDKSVRVDIYAEMLDIAYKIIKKHNINDVVIVGGLIADTEFDGGYPPSTFMKALSLTSAAESYDAVAIHPYWGDYLPESPKEMRTVDNLKRMNLANYMNDFIEDVQFYAKRDVKIYVTEMGVENKSLYNLNKKMGISNEWLEVAIMARSFATLLSFPEVQTVIWFVYAPVSGGETFAMSDYAKVHMKRISQTLDQAEPLGFYRIKDESGDFVKGAWEYRYRLPNGKIVSWFWDQAETYEEGPAYLKGAKTGSVGHFFVDEKIEGTGAPVDKENPFPFGSLPGILIGDISDEMVITKVGNNEKNEFKTMYINGSETIQAEYLELTFNSAIWHEDYDDFLHEHLSSTSIPNCKIHRPFAIDGIGRRISREEKLVGKTTFIAMNDLDDYDQIYFQQIEWDKRYGLILLGGDNPEVCLNEAWEVIRQSEANNFGIDESVNINPTAEVPVVDESITDVATVEFEPGYYLSYDPDIWQKADGNPGQRLKLNSEETCIIHSQWGHGYNGEIIGVTSTDQKIGNTTFTISRYWLRSSGEIVMYGYHWGGSYVNVENTAGVILSDNCLYQVDKVMRLSEARGFKQ